MTDKFVSFRIEKQNRAGAMNSFYHDFRRHTPSYVDKSRSELNKTILKGQFFEDVLTKVKAEEEELRPKHIFDYYEINQKERVKNLTKRKAQKNAELFNSGIMTFSPSMAEDYANNSELFEEKSKQFLEQLKEQFGFNVMYAQLHLDEETPHVHILFDNIGFDGKGVRRNINPYKLMQIQTLMGDCFAEMGYKRGKPASETRREHLSVYQYKEAAEAIETLLEVDRDNAKRQIDNFMKDYAEGKPEAQALMTIFNQGKTIDEMKPDTQKRMTEYADSLKEQKHEPKR